MKHGIHEVTICRNIEPSNEWLIAAQSHKRLALGMSLRVLQVEKLSLDRSFPVLLAWKMRFF